MELNKRRDSALDAVKGFAILIVMLGHCIVLNGLNDPYFYDMIVAVQMPLFMAVSGFIAGKTSLKLNIKPDVKLRLKQLGKRTVAYLVPFFSWLVLTHLTNPLQELRLQLFALDRGLWFLMTLWVVTVVTVLASYLADLCAWKCKGNAWLRFGMYAVTVAVCYLFFVLQARSGNTFLSPSLTVKYLPFYVAGYLCMQYLLPILGKNGKKQKGKVLFTALWLMAIVAFVFLIVLFDMIVVTNSVTLLAQMMASFLGSFACFYGVYRFAGGRIKTALAFIGQFTLEIYVLHFRFARLLGIGDKAPKVGSVKAFGWIVAAFVVMSVLTALCIWLMKKIWILDFLLFGKRKNDNYGKK